MFWTVTALVMTVVMGGFIAYNGDVIGRKFGKRRATLFGLRPRHTAIVITVCTGTVISALTTGVLFLVVPPVRDVILEGESAIRDSARLRKEKRQLELEAGSARVAIADLHVRENTLQTELKNLGGRLRTSAASLADVRAQLGRANEAVQRAQAARGAAEAATARAEVARRQEAVRAASLRKANHELARTNSDMAEQSVSLTRENDALSRANTELSSKNADIRRQTQDLEAHNAEIAAQNVTLTRNNGTLLGVNRQLLDANAALSADKARLAKQKDDLERSARGVFGNLLEMVQALRTRRMAVRGGEELARGVIPAGASPDQVREGLSSLMHQAHLAALVRGAAIGERARAVEIVDKQFFTRLANGEAVSVSVSEDDRLNALVNRLAWSSDPVCVLALAVSNSVEREPAGIDIQPLPDRLLYRRGQVLATRRVDATQAPSVVFNELVGFLKALGRSALDRGMIPSIDPTTGEPQVGSLEVGDIADLVERLRRTGSRVYVTARAARDLNAADPLLLQFSVDRAL